MVGVDGARGDDAAEFAPEFFAFFFALVAVRFGFVSGAFTVGLLSLVRLELFVPEVLLLELISVGDGLAPEDSTLTSASKG